MAMPDQGENAADHGRRHQDSILSPRFRSAAALAGWDEQTLLACLIVEDTPNREQKIRRRTTPLISKNSQSASRRKRRIRRGSTSTVVSVFNLEDDGDKDLKDDAERSEKQNPPKPSADVKREAETYCTQKTKVSGKTPHDEKRTDTSAPKTLPASDQNLGQERLDRLREELSCVVCLDICFEPSTTPCGHSFCKRCLRSAIDKCGKKCPKCRQMISNSRACTINTVLWNTIQLLFPEEIEAKKAWAMMNNAENKLHNNKTYSHDHDTREQPSFSRRLSRNSSRRRVSSIEDEDGTGMWTSGQLSTSERVSDNNSSRRGVPSQSEDAALAFRLQREEFLGNLRGLGREFRASSLFSARENLRAMATRAVNLRSRNRSPT